MQVTKINNSYSATGQINVGDLDEIFADGFKTIVCFRPEEEDTEHQPKHKTLQEAAAQKGMTFLSISYLYYRLLQSLNIAF
jgi:sulfide:quinone oxidoreductase